jgi:hypothetical protein
VATPSTVVMNAVSAASRPVAIRTSDERGASAVASTTYQPLALAVRGDRQLGSHGPVHDRIVTRFLLVHVIARGRS